MGGDEPHDAPVDGSVGAPVDGSVEGLVDGSVERCDDARVDAVGGSVVGRCEDAQVEECVDVDGAGRTPVDEPETGPVTGLVGGPADGVHDLVAGVAAMQAAAGMVVQATGRSWSVSDAQVRAAVEDLTRLAARVEAARLAVIGVLDGRPGAVPGASAGRVAAAFLVGRLHVDPGRAAADVAAAHALDSEAGVLPAVGAALADGLITKDHAVACVKAADRLPRRLQQVEVTIDPDDPDDAGLAADLGLVCDGAGPQVLSGMQVADRWLAGQARRFGVREVGRLAERLVAVLAPDRTERFDPDAHLRRGVSFSRDSTGMGVLRAQLTPADAVLMDALLAAVSAPNPARTCLTRGDTTHGHHGADGGAGDGRDSGGAGDGRDSGGAGDGGQPVRVRDERSRTMRQYDGLMAVFRAGIGQPATDPTPSSSATSPGDTRATDPDSARSGAGGGDPGATGQDDPGATGQDDPGATGQDDVGGSAGSNRNRDPAGDAVGNAADDADPADDPAGDDVDAPASPAGQPDRTGHPTAPGGFAPTTEQGWLAPTTEQGWLAPTSGPGWPAPAAPTPAVTVLVTATLEQLAAAALTQQRATGQPSPQQAAGQQSARHLRARRHTAASPTAAPPTGSRPVGSAAGLAHVQHTGPINPDLLAYLTCTATLQRVLLAPTGAPLDVGRAQRLATPAQRRALAARDGGCVIPACGCPHEGTDAHHLVPWAAGGGTDLTNMVSLCPTHHQQVHSGVWTIQIIDGIPWVRPPSWVDPRRRLTRNTLHHHTSAAATLGQQLRLALDDQTAFDADAA